MQNKKKRLAKIILLALLVILLSFTLAQAKIRNKDVAKNAKIKYRKLKLTDKVRNKDISKNTAINPIKISGTALTGNSLFNGDVSGRFSSLAVADDSHSHTSATLPTTMSFLGSSIETAEISNGTIRGEDLASNIELNTTGNVSANDLAVNGGDISSTAANLTINPAGSGNVNPGADGTDNLGAAATRWSTIYANTLNFKNTLTDTTSNSTVSFGDNADATITLGDENGAGNDAVSITAETAILDAQWSISNAGAASFTSAAVNGNLTFVNNENIDNLADGAFNFSRNDAGVVTMTVSDNDANADLLLTAGGTGDITLGDADSDLTVAHNATVNNNFIANGDVTLGAGFDDNIAINGDDWSIADNGNAAFNNLGVDTGAIVDFSAGSALKIPTINEALVDGADGGNSCANGNKGDIRIDNNNSFFGCDGTNWQKLD